jgi:membrane carboxypeptidase/penicillin-binding protein PbpC
LQIPATATLNIVRQSPQRASSYKRSHDVKKKRNKIQQESAAAAEQAAEEERMQQLEAEEKCIKTARKERQLHMELEKQRFTG